MKTSWRTTMTLRPDVAALIIAALSTAGLMISGIYCNRKMAGPNETASIRATSNDAPIPPVVFSWNNTSEGLVARTGDSW